MRYKRCILQVLIFIALLIIYVNPIYGLGGYLEIKPPADETNTDTTPDTSAQEKDTHTECEKQGGTCKCGCDSETEFWGYGRLECPFFNCFNINLGAGKIR